MKIKMLETQRGSVDGCRVSAYEQGAEYDLTTTQGERELASAFVGAGMATEIGETIAPIQPVSAAPAAEPELPVVEVPVVAAPKPGRKKK